MTEIRWTTEAADQLEAVGDRIRKDNPEAAYTTCQAILDHVAGASGLSWPWPTGESGRARANWSTPPYVIVYRLNRDVAEILHIWHGAQDWP